MLANKYDWFDWRELSLDGWIAMLYGHMMYHIALTSQFNHQVTMEKYQCWTNLSNMFIDLPNYNDQWSNLNDVNHII